ncbi:hypothetical protein [Paenibacillus sp. MY03]|uniref:hypothetical protein n=1 Tax=Paenibacillus sp. MY03 TaxID=302980 RepID=UPI00117F7D25|nr:hypothetical protein [Paenibacillus sp. MY03]
MMAVCKRAAITGLLGLALLLSFAVAASANNGFAAEYVAESTSSITLHPGETKSFWVELRNTGTETWLFGWPSHEVVLAHTDSSYSHETSSMYSGNNSWLTYSRPAAPNYAGIQSGGIGRFEFKVTGQEEIGTTRMYLRPVRADGTFLNNLGIWVDITVVPYPEHAASVGSPVANQAAVSWAKSTANNFGSYRIYKFPKTYPALKYYSGGDWSKNFQYLPQLHPYYLDRTVTDVNALSYLSSIEADKSYVYIVDVIDVSGNIIARSEQLEARNVSGYTVKPQERGQRLYYDPQLGDYRNTETRGYIESNMRWSTDSAEILLSLKTLPETYALASTQQLADFVKESMPRGLPTHRWTDFMYGQGASVYVDPQLRFDNGVYEVTGDLSVPRLTFFESTYGSKELGALRFAYGYDGLEPIEVANPDVRTVDFDEETNTMLVSFSKQENNVRVQFDVSIRGGVIEVEGSLTPIQGSVSNPRLIVKARNDDGIGDSDFFASVKQWGSDAWLLYDDGKGFVRGEDLAKNNPARFEGILQSNGSSYFKYNGTLAQGQTWQEYLEKIRFGSHMLGGTADHYEPTEYDSATYDNYLFGRLMNYGYPVMGLASWSVGHPADTEAKVLLDSAIGIMYQNMLSYPAHNWSSFEDKDNGSLYWGELGPLLYGLAVMAEQDSVTLIFGKTYEELAQFVYDRLPPAATGLFAVDNDGLGNAIYGIRKFKGILDAKVANYETHLLTINEANNQGYYTTKTYLGYADRHSVAALNALSHFLQLPQWDTQDALIIRNSLGYAGMGESQAWGQIVFDALEKQYGGVYPILIGTDTPHDHQPVQLTQIGWNAGTATLSMSFNRPFEELSVYTGSAGLAEVRLNGQPLTAGLEYTFDELTHILRIKATNEAVGAFAIAVTVD